MFQWKRFQFFDKEQRVTEDKQSVLKVRPLLVANLF